MEKQKLEFLYKDKKLSIREISEIFNCSENKINYWFRKFDIPKRTISEAIYQYKNPKGDPFLFINPKKYEEVFLFGLGLGLYWGEGTKANKSSVRLGNSNPYLIKKFINFLVKIYSVKKSKMKFGVQIFNDLNPYTVLDFWTKILNIERSQFQKPVVTKIRGPGTYKNKAKYGVVTVYFNNKKLRNLLCEEIEKLSRV